MALLPMYRVVYFKKFGFYEYYEVQKRFLFMWERERCCDTLDDAKNCIVKLKMADKPPTKSIVHKE